MEIQGLFAVACVSDMEKSVVWYTSLFGRSPDDRPMEGLVQWRNVGGAGLQLVLDAEKAGASLITIVTPKMARAREELASASLQLKPDIQGDFGVLAQIDDPDGNRITLAEPPKEM
jgi:predicted enzyme related to lactoylglutathione lyase